MYIGHFHGILKLVSSIKDLNETLFMRLEFKNKLSRSTDTFLEPLFCIPFSLIIKYKFSVYTTKLISQYLVNLFKSE